MQTKNIDCMEENVYENKMCMITKIIPLNFDMAFTTIFNKEKNISILEHFLSCYLELSYESIKGNLKLLNRNLIKSHKKEAKKEIDLLLDYKGKK